MGTIMIIPRPIIQHSV